MTDEGLKCFITILERKSFAVTFENSLSNGIKIRVSKFNDSKISIFLFYFKYAFLFYFCSIFM